MISDHNIAWKRKRKFYAPFDLNCLIVAAVDEAGSVAFTEGELLQNPTASNKAAPDVCLGEVTTTGNVGILFTAAGAIALGRIRLPDDLDPSFPIGLRINWAGSAAAAADRGVLWLLLYETVLKEAAYQTTINNALDTIFVEDLNSGSGYNEWTNRGIIRRIGLTRQQIEDGAILQFSLEADAIDSGTATLHGIELDYVPQLCVGGGSLVDRPLQSMGIN